MRLSLAALCAVLVAGGVMGYQYLATTNTGAPPYAEADLDPPQDDGLGWIKNWQRPEGPARVGLQVGHWKNSDMPEELQRLEGNTGTSGGGRWEWEVNLDVAVRTKDILESRGVKVDILPATVPPAYLADVFLAIHADGSVDRTKSGYKFANPRRDYTGKGERLLESLEQAYSESTGLAEDPNVTRNMRGYYAFAWWRYEHAVHPMTVAAIAETGFLTSPSDQRLLIGKPEIVAGALAEGIWNYLAAEGLVDN